MRVRGIAVAGTAGLTLLGGGWVIPSSAGAEEPTDGVVVATGELTENGHPVSGEIAVRIWPNDVVLNQLDEGAAVPLLELPTSSTAPNGDFTVSIPSDLPAEYLGSGSDVEVEVVASDGDSATTYSLSAIVDEVPVDETPPVDEAPPVDGAVSAASTNTSAGTTRIRPTTKKPGESDVHITLDVGVEKARKQRASSLTTAASAGLAVADATGTPGVSPAGAFGLAEQSGRPGE